MFPFLNTHPCTSFICSKNQLGFETGAESEQRILTVRELGRKHQGIQITAGAQLSSVLGCHQAVLKDPQITGIPDPGTISTAF